MSFFIPEGIDDSGLTGVITLQEVIDIWGQEFIEQLKHSLDAEGLGNSDLKQQLSYEIVQKGDVIKFRLFFPDYGTFIDEGVKGAGGARKTTSKYNKRNSRGKLWKQNAPTSRFKFTVKKPPMEALKKWSKARGISPWAVREIVFRQGIKPKSWFTDVIDQNPFSKLATELEIQGAKAIELEIAKVFSKGQEEIDKI